MTDNMLLISEFSTVIQLWAGLYLLFMFEELLLRSPFQALDGRIDSLISELYQRFPELSQKEEIEKVNLWDNIIKSRRSIAIFSLLASSAVLVYSVFDGKSDVNHHSVYLIFDIILFLFNIVVAGWSNVETLQKKRYVALFFPISLILTYGFYKLPTLIEISDEIVICMTLFALASGLLILIVQLYVCQFYIKKKEICIIKIEEDLKKIPYSIGSEIDNDELESIRNRVDNIYKDVKKILKTRVVEGLYLYFKKEHPFN